MGAIVAAAWSAWRASRGEINGASIRALAHRVVQGWNEEGEAFPTLFEVAGDGGFTSHVTDCYAFERAVDEHLVPLAREAAKRGSLIVARPDSGDGETCVRYILEAAKRGIYGIGGYLRDCLRRDGMGATMKPCAVGE